MGVFYWRSLYNFYIWYTNDKKDSMYVYQQILLLLLANFKKYRQKYFKNEFLT